MGGAGSIFRRVRIFAAGSALLALSVGRGLADATLSQQIDPPDANVGDQVTVTFTIQNAAEPPTVTLPRVDGLQQAGSSSMTNITFTNGTLASSASTTFVLIPVRPGDFTIPAFEIHAHDGEVLHARAMKLHVGGSGATAAAPQTPQAPSGNGPVVMPPINQAPPPESSETVDDGSGVKAPAGSDGRPVKVFMVITPQTTDAYVGQTIPMKIEFYIRMDSLASQDSLPTISGSDFLMNDLSLRPMEDELEVGDEPYHRETWMTAIAPSHSGDFPLVLERDTYWQKDSNAMFMNPLGNFFNPHGNLAHGNVMSNKLVIHAHALPEEGKPAGFTGAIGDFKVEGNVNPQTLAVGDPAYLDFTISGEGNFGSVRAPYLADDPDWKTYQPTSQMQYVDEAHLRGTKTFHQAIIPKKNGQVPLPPANFSYFDPQAKKYVTVPVILPVLTVTGSPLPAASAAAPDNNAVTAAPTPANNNDLLGNRLELGELHSSLIPAWGHPWFWISQGLAVALALLTGLAAWMAARRGRDTRRAELLLHQRSLSAVEAAMTEAARNGDAPAFFAAARRVVQLRWGARWGVPPESVTPASMAAHDPHLAEAMEPLFAQADEVIYSGRAPDQFDLMEWERRVREEILQLQPT